MFDDPQKNRGTAQDHTLGPDERVGPDEPPTAASAHSPAIHLPGPRTSALRLRSFASGETPVDLFSRVRGFSHPWLLDSAQSTPPLGRFSFFGADPYLVLRARDRRIDLDCRRSIPGGLAPGRIALEADPFEILRALLPPRPSERAGGTAGAGQADEPPFVGGAVGYLGYELARHLEHFDPAGRDDLGLPDLVMLFVDRVVACDHERGTVTLCGLGFGDDPESAANGAEAALDGLARDLSEGASRRASARARPTARSAATVPDVDAGTYAKAVDEVKQEIAAGNVYQACLTHRMEREWSGDPWTLYRRLRSSNPAPFASYFELPEVAIASSSPERFLRVEEDGSAESRPIKGTRPRGAAPEEDRALRDDLVASAKDRAENLMIVDLVRNDLGRVCETGSVSVPELMAIEEYASVFQMVSTVRGRMRGDRDVVDLVRATFPPGSMTGAPKIAAMQILDRLEPVRRGIYSGAIGYFDARGGADLAVSIRLVLVREGRALVHSGGGIVADSDPGDEYLETLDKVGPLLSALAGGSGAGE